MHKRCLCCRLVSVCLSLSFWCIVIQMAKDIVKLLSWPGSHNPKRLRWHCWVLWGFHLPTIGPIKKLNNKLLTNLIVGRIVTGTKSEYTVPPCLISHFNHWLHNIFRCVLLRLKGFSLIYGCHLLYDSLCDICQLQSGEGERPTFPL